jgi:Ca2+-binding EF-hand superfamily protein
LTFDVREEMVTRAAFAAAVRTAGYGPIAVTAIAGRADSQQLSAALFRHLDRDGDGRLSPDELKTARERLAFLDVNEDELLSAAELLGRSVSAAARMPVAAGMMAAEESGTDSPDLVVLTPDGGPAVKQLLTARAGSRATSLRPTDFGAGGPAFAALDKDGNGKLDTAELAEWLRQPPDLEFALTFGPGEMSARLTPLGEKGRYRVEAGGVVAAALAGARFRFEPLTGGVAAERATWVKAADRLREQLRQPPDKAGPARLNPADGLPALVEFADRLAGGKAGPEQIDAILKTLTPLAGCRVKITFVERGGGLYELLDRNGDGQLSPRELAEAAAALKQFAGPDGKVGPNDLPRQIEVHSAVSSVPVLPPPPVPRMAAPTPVRPPAPAWFTRMDRNGDGDVSLREFLGPLELFRKLDRDGDGLISPAEAWAAEGGTKH